MRDIFSLSTQDLSVKKVLFIATSKNKLQWVTARSFELTLQRTAKWEMEFTSIYALGKEVSKNAEESPRDFSKYDLVVVMPIFNAMFVSGRGTSVVFKQLASQVQEDRLMFYNDDVTLYTNSRVMNVKTREWEESFLARPIKILGNFTESVVTHPTALAQAKHRWYRHLHEATEIIPVEMTLTWTEARRESLRFEHLDSLAIDFDYPDRIESFYCGLHKRRVIPSLRKLGLGAHADDAVMGPIAHRFPTAKDLTIDESYTPFPILAKLISLAERNLLPFEKIKCEVQPSPRLAELLVATTPDKIIADSRVSKDIWSLTDETVRQTRIRYASEKLNALIV